MKIFGRKLFYKKSEIFITLLAFLLLTVCEASLFYLFKMRFYLHSCMPWVVSNGGFMITVLVLWYIYSNDWYGMDAAEHCHAHILTIAMVILSAIAWLILILGAIGSSSMFHARSRYKAVSEMVDRIEDSGDVSAFPNLLGKDNDTSNLPLIGIPEAIKKAETEMGRMPALGSQFYIMEEDVTSQSINGELCYVIPLQPKDFLKWDRKGNRGYFIVDRNNGKTTFVEDSLMTTTMAPFGDATKRIIIRYLRSIGEPGLVTEISPEVDDGGKFHYVATIYTVDGIGGMRHVKGIVEVDAATKSCQYYALDEIPEYVDRVYPEDFFEEYLRYYGGFKNGYWNSVFAKKEVQVQTADMDVLYVDGTCYYYTGFTSAGKGESSNGIMMMNSRTGEIEYHVTYGISEDKAQSVAEGLVQEKGYTASYPLLLKVGNQETYFMLMRDASENLVSYAFVSYKDYTKAAVANSLLEAQATYVKAFATDRSSSVLDEKETKTVDGKISDITSEVVDGTTIYYVKVDGNDTIFQMYSSLDIGIVFAKPGDGISIGYYDSGNAVETAVTCTLK